MKRRLSFPSAALATAICSSPAFGAPTLMVPLDVPQPTNSLVMAASDCYAVGQAVAAQQGGTLAKASQSKRGGQTVCVIVVLVPGKDGQRPRRAEIVVPLS